MLARRRGLGSRLAAVCGLAATVVAASAGSPRPASAAAHAACTGRPLLSSTFVQPDVAGVSGWSEWAWEQELTELRSVCIGTVVLQYTRSEPVDGGPVIDYFGPRSAVDVLDRLFAAARAVGGIQIVVGLQAQPGWEQSVGPEWADAAAASSAQLAAALNADVGADSAFGGWYLPPEPAPSILNTPERRAGYLSYAGQTAAALTALTAHAPIMLSPAFDSLLPRSASTGLLRELAEVPGVTQLMLQDRTGEPWEPIGADSAKLGTWFAAAAAAVHAANAGTGRQVQLWSDVETYRLDERGGVRPATTRALLAAMRAEAPYVEGLGSFSFVHYLSRYGWFRPRRSPMRTTPAGRSCPRTRPRHRPCRSLATAPPCGCPGPRRTTTRTAGTCRRSTTTRSCGRVPMAHGAPSRSCPAPMPGARPAARRSASTTRIWRPAGRTGIAWSP